MKLKFVLRRARVWSFIFAALAFTFLAAPQASAQEEAAPQVVDEPIAQVNNDVIMLSQLKRQMIDFKEALVKQRGMTEQQAEEELKKRQPEIIANLINEQLLLQRGKEMPRMTEDIEAEVNRTMLGEAARMGIKTIEELDTRMRAEGLSPEEIRQTLRTQYMRQAVLSREVDAKIYYNLSNDEVRKYYDAHRDKFQGVTLSEIFLSRAGRSEADVRAKATQIVAQARGGADFGALAAANSEREIDGARVAEKTKGRIEDDKGKLKWFLISDLHASFGAAVKDMKAGQVTDPIISDDGVTILRVNDRDDAFKEQQVRGQIVEERRDKEREIYMNTLRKDAYINVAKDYKEAVLPLLKIEPETPANTKAATTTAKNQKDKKSN